ncbi:MAG TPA: hypothetical protein VMD05_09620, partial [Candidatus Nanoarchaeia archaeon]|nr:hypothetical protein [Candidatus Nanoarchaeia archaeon]
SSTAEAVEKETRGVVVEANDMAKLAEGVVGDAAKVEDSAKKILEEAESVGRNANTVVAQVTTMAGATEQMKNDLIAAIEHRKEVLNRYLEKAAAA